MSLKPIIQSTSHILMKSEIPREMRMGTLSAEMGLIILCGIIIRGDEGAETVGMYYITRNNSMEKSYLIRIWNKDIITRNTKSIKNLLLTKQS